MVHLKLGFALLPLAFFACAIPPSTSAMATKKTTINSESPAGSIKPIDADAEANEQPPNLAGVWDSNDDQEVHRRLIVCEDGTTHMGTVRRSPMLKTKYSLMHKNGQWEIHFRRDHIDSYERVDIKALVSLKDGELSFGGAVDEATPGASIVQQYYRLSEQESPCHGAAPPLNVAYQIRSYFYAGGESEGLGGHYVEKENLPVPIPSAMRADRGLRLLVETNSDGTWSTYQARTVRLFNARKGPAQFEAQDSVLDLVHEAKDAKGEWRAIEYTPQSWCGNSFHELTLPAHSMWTWKAPVYAGSFKTTLRLRLESASGPIYSNTFEGSVNPEQFAEKQGHTATDIMDPYRD